MTQQGKEWAHFARPSKGIFGGISRPPNAMSSGSLLDPRAFGIDSIAVIE
jgi:hypothetical protein